MELFTPKVPEKDYHYNFRMLTLCDNEAPYITFWRNELNRWAEGFTDRDNKFEKEFQTEGFNACFWELYIFAVLKELKYEADFEQNRPDFCLKDINVIIEAVTASNPKDGPKEYQIDKFDKKVLIFDSEAEKFNDASILRLSNSISAKYKKYIDSYCKLDHVKEKPFVIALADFSQPVHYLNGHNPIEELLLGFHSDEVIFMDNQRKKIFNNNGSPIDLGIFNNDKYKEISAIIYSNCATLSKLSALSEDSSEDNRIVQFRLDTNSTDPLIIHGNRLNYRETLLDGLRIYHNPYAEIPLDNSLFYDENNDIFHAYMINGEWFYRQRDMQLLYKLPHDLYNDILQVKKARSDAMKLFLNI